MGAVGLSYFDVAPVILSNKFLSEKVILFDVAILARIIFFKATVLSFRFSSKPKSYEPKMIENPREKRRL